MVKVKGLNHQQIYEAWQNLGSYQKVADSLKINRETVRIAVRKARGTCYLCSQLPFEGHSFCLRHLELARANRKRKYYEYKAKGLCHKCGKNPVYRNIYCKDCYPLYRRAGLQWSYRSRYGGYRQEILDRDNHSCILCGKQVTSKNVIVHRIDNKNHDKVRPDETSPADFLTLCRHCHASLHALLDYSPLKAIKLLQLISPL